jgi:uncharacterized membrane protein
MQAAPGRGRRVSLLFLFGAAFLACAVEMVEALTIVLAVGAVRGWRSPLAGVAAAALVLAALVAALGPALRVLPIDALRLVVGTLLLTFGLQWLRKAILRASGYKERRDEAAAFQRLRDQATAAADDGRTGLDWYAFTLSFKGVLLEGLEVALIVVSFDSGQGRLPVAAAAAGAALVVVAAVGVLVRAPLARVPENTIKFAVGMLLTSFGSFWAVEGAGVRWPGDEAALVGLLAFTSAVALVLLRRLQRQRRALRAVGIEA